MSEVIDKPTLVFSRERRFHGEPFTDIVASVHSSIVKGVLPARGTGFLVGPSGAGKTFIATDWGLRISCGGRVLGRRTKRVGVAYLGAEDPEGCRLRIAAWKTKNPRGSYTPFTFFGQRVDLLNEDEVDQFIAELQDLAALYEENGFPLGLVIIDTFARCIPGAEENSSQQMSLGLDALDRIAREVGCLVLAIAHHGKDGTKGVRGWSGLNAGSDATITVERDEITPDLRKITLSKVKNGRDGEVFAFGLERQNVGIIDEDGEELWTCVVRYDDLPPEKIAKGRRRQIITAGGEIILTSLGRLIDKEVRQAPPSLAEGVRKGTWAVRREDLSLEAKTSGLGYDGDKANTYNVRFGRELEKLVGIGKIRIMGDAVWPL